MNSRSRLPVVTWKEQSKLQQTRKRKRISEELAARDPGQLCSFEEGLAQFPTEVILVIFTFLDVKSRISCAGVCRRWRDLALDAYLWRRTTISNMSCSSMQRVFKLALIGGHLQALTLTGGRVSALVLKTFPLTVHAAQSWFRDACCKLHHLHIELFAFSDSRLPIRILFRALPPASLQSMVIKDCLNYSDAQIEQQLYSTADFPHLKDFRLVSRNKSRQLAKVQTDSPP
eukprot:scpid91821/ scgid22873/ 